MSESNGDQKVLKIGKKGLMKVEIGDSPAFTVDVVQVTNQWAEIDRQFRDENGAMPPERLAECNGAAWKYVCDLSGIPDLSLTNALEFLAEMTKEGRRLSAFFDLRTATERGSPEPTEVTFST